MSPNRARCPGASALGLLIAALTGSASAAEYDVRPEIQVDQFFDDNPLNVDDDTQVDDDDSSSWNTSLAPRVRLWRKSDTSEGSLELGMTRRKSWSLSELDGTDEHLRGSFRRALTQRLSVGLTGSYDDYEAQDPVTENFQLLFAERPDTLWRSLGGDVRYVLDDRTELSANLDWDAREYDKTSRYDLFDSEGRAVSVSLLRQLSSRDRAGVVAAMSFSEEESHDSYRHIGLGIYRSLEAVSRDELRTLLAVWERIWSPRWLTALRVGARYLDTESDSVEKTAIACATGLCTSPLVPPGLESNNDSGTGFIGGLSVTHAYSDRGSLTASYQRDTRTGTTSSTGSSAIDTDNVSASLVHKLWPRLTFTFAGNYTVYETTSDFLVRYAGIAQAQRVKGGNEYHLRSAEVRVDWQVRRNLTAYASFRYNDLDQDQVFEQGIFGTIHRQREYQRRIFGVGFRYAFDVLGREL